MKKPPDHDPSLHAAVVACALIVAAVIVLASLAGEASKSLEAWVNRYQTLITGFFAIGAAYLTVFQMRVSDAKSDKRHLDLLALSLRPDALRIDRAFRKLPYIVLSLDDILLQNPLKEEDSDEVFFEKAYAYRQQTRSAYERMRAVLDYLESIPVVDLQPLFSAELSILHGQARAVLAATGMEIRAHEGALQVYDRGESNYDSVTWKASRIAKRPAVTATPAPDLAQALVAVRAFADAALELKSRYDRYIDL